MSTLSYLNYADISAFEGLYQQFQQATDSVDQEWYNFFEWVKFSKADFFQWNKRSRMPHARSAFAEASRNLCWIHPGNALFTCN